MWSAVKFAPDAAGIAACVEQIGPQTVRVGPAAERQHFTFDRIAGEDVDQEEIFQGELRLIA